MGSSGIAACAASCDCKGGALLLYGVSQGLPAGQFDVIAQDNTFFWCGGNTRPTQDDRAMIFLFYLNRIFKYTIMLFRICRILTLQITGCSAPQISV